MARCIIYKRSLDVKVLPSSGNSNHEFQFVNLAEIKKEVDNESLDMESGLTPGATVTNSSGLHDDHDLQLRSVIAPVQMLESDHVAHSKLVIKFREPRKESEQSVDIPQKRKKTEDRESENEISTILKPRRDRKSDSSFLSKVCVTRSSSLTPRPSDGIQETKSTTDRLQRPASARKGKLNVRKTGQLKKNVSTTCESCGLRFLTKRKLHAHERYWTPKGALKCITCDQSFSRSYLLTRHLRVIHFATPAIRQNYKFECHFCNDRFQKKSSLIAHVVHLHNKPVVSKKKSTNGNKESASSLKSGAQKKTKGSLMESRIDDDSGLIKDSSGLAGNSCDASGNLIDGDLTVQQNKPTANQFTGEKSIDFEKEKVDGNSNSNPKKTDRLKQNRIVMNLDKSKDERTTMLQQIIYSNNDSTKKFNESRVVKETIDNGDNASTMNTGALILQRSNEDRSQTQRRSQTGVEENVQPQGMGNLLDHLGNAVGNWRTTQPYNQSDKQDYISGSSSASTTTDLGIADMLRSTRSSILKSTILISSKPNITDTGACSDHKLTQDEDSSFQKKNMNVTEKNSFANERLKILTQGGKSDKQVGPVQSHQASEELETARGNVDTEDVANECNDFDIDIIQVNDFGGTSVKIEDEEVSGDGCEPISLDVATSSSNISLTNSLSPKFDRVTTLNSCNTRDHPKMKDLRVSLVKLENMLNVGTKTRPPESSPLDNYSSVKTETPHCDPGGEQSKSNLALRQYPRRKHDRQVVDSGSIIRKLRETTNKFRRVISKKNGLRGGRELGQRTTKRVQAPKKQCHLCDEVFQHVLFSALHYLEVHTEVGSLKCCICDTSWKDRRKLRGHLYSHHSEIPERKLRKFCVTCKKQLSISSLGLCCPNCNENSNARHSKEEKEVEQVPNVKVSIKHDHTQVVAKVDGLENGSLFEISSVSMSKKRAKSNTPVVHHESAKNDKIVLTPGARKKFVKNFNCFVCNGAFFKSSQLRHHLSVAHADVKYRRSKRYQSVFKLQTLSYSTSRDCKRGSRKRSRDENNLPNFNVREKKYSQSKGTRSIHDKFCKKKSYEQRRRKFFEINSRSQHFIRQHNIRGNAKTRYEHKCDVCGLKCCCRKNLEIHKKRYSINGKNACNICGRIFARKQVLATHMKAAHNQKILFPGKLTCEICNQRFHNRKFLRIHLAHFHNLKYYQCTICRTRFGTSRGLNNHTRYYSQNRSNLCGICGQSLKCKYMLQYHIAQVHDRRKLKAYKYLCKICDCAFTGKLLLRAHIGHFHNIQTREAEENAINKDVSTGTEQVSENIELPVRTDIICNDSNDSTNISTIQKDVIAADHAETTSDEPAVVGEIIRTHTSSRYKCDICKLNFNDPYAMLNHEWEYSNEGTFACNVCNRKFTTYFLLKNHKIKHFQRNVIRDYECYICKEDFSRADHLNIHGLHLHGPAFVLAKGSGTDDILDNSISEFEIDSDRDSVLKESTVDDGYELVAGYHKTIQCGKILLFRKFGHNKSSTESPRRNSNEDAYSCYFCQTSFSSSILLKSHIKKHDYRPYYNNSSRYLCLICKDKFRTNDLLRAHVVHCHTSDPQEQSLSGSKESRIHSDIQSSDNKNDNTTDSVAANSAMDAIQNPTFSSVIEESDYPEIISHIELNSTPEEVKFFTAKVEDVEGLQKYMCTICIVTFDSVEQFVEHFAATHVKNGAFLCTFCGARFLLMVDLKDHTLKHEKESKKYVCCDEKFLLVTDFVRHQSSHDGRIEEEQDEPDTQLSLSVEPEGGSRKEFSDEPNAADPCKCEICGEILIDFESMLKHWDSCIDMNGLQCNLCKATFKSLTSFRVHQTTHHQGKLDGNPIQNRRSPRVISDQIIQVSMQDSIMHGNKPRTINKSMNMNVTKKLERAVALTSILPKKYEPLKSGNITVKPLAKEVNNLKNVNKCHVNEHQKNNGTGPWPELKPNQDVLLPKRGSMSKKSPRMISIENFDAKIHWRKQDDSTTPVSTFPQAVNSSTQARQLDKEVSKDIPCSANENRSLYHLPVQGVNNISKVHVGSNDSSLRLQQNECQEQKLTRSEAIPSNIVNDLSSISSTARTSINIDNMKFASSESGEKTRSNDCGRQESLNLIPASSSAADNAAIFICIQPTADYSNNINNAMILPSDSGQTVQPNDSSSTLPTSLVPFSLDAGPSPAYFLCLTPAPDNSSKCIIQEAPLNDSKLKSQPNNHTGKKLPTILRKSPTLVPNPIHNNDVPQKAVYSNKKKKHNVVPYDSTSHTRLISNSVMKAPKLPPAPSTSTSGKLSESEIRVTNSIDIPTDQSASNKELASKKQIVRCSYCNLLFTEEAKLIQHMDSHKRNNQCPACGLTFSNEKALQLHLPEHKSSTCTKCKMIAFFSDSLTRPKGAAKYCTACATLLPLPKRRNTRFANNFPHKIMKCGICMDTFGTMSQMTDHFKKFHSDFVCGTCESRFSTKVSLYGHLRTHGSKNPALFQCKTCKKYFLDGIDLAAHSLSH